MRKNSTAEEKRQLKRFGQLIMKLSGGQNKSLERVGYEAGLSKSYMYDIANGRANPSLIVLLKLSDLLELPLWKIFKELDA
jgi:transcriptional regulator with XRE-family HTH domain